MPDTQDVAGGFSIDSAKLTVSPGPALPEAPPRPKRGRRTKAEMEAARAAESPQTVTPAVTEEPLKVIRVRPVHGRRLFCKTQGKTIHPSFENQVLADAWIMNQVKHGVLQIVG